MSTWHDCNASVPWVYTFVSTSVGSLWEFKEKLVWGRACNLYFPMTTLLLWATSWPRGRLARQYPNFDAGTYLFWRTKIKNHISGLEKMEPQGFVLW
ncbi:hypothetical protein MCOR02_005422 [Pyricularia oryzae]|nr:hypothetical protein MCOR02_005422 [Pyricularia oryzae]